jgi:hypothetical protein
MESKQWKPVASSEIWSLMIQRGLPREGSDVPTERWVFIDYGALSKEDQQLARSMVILLVDSIILHIPSKYSPSTKNAVHGLLRHPSMWGNLEWPKEVEPPVEYTQRVDAAGLWVPDDGELKEEEA